MKASLPEVNQFTGNCFRVVRIVLKITFLKLRYPGQRPESPSLSYYGSWAGLFSLLLFGRAWELLTNSLGRDFMSEIGLVQAAMKIVDKISKSNA